MVDRQALGRWGEELAAQHLETQGYEILARNWRCRSGELDIVARTGSVLAFVEVKTRSGTAYGEPAEAVTPEKARRIHRLAYAWMEERQLGGWHDPRFDVISVIRRPPASPELLHLTAAF